MRKFNVTVNGKTYAVEVEETAADASAPTVAPAPTPVQPQPVKAATGGTPVASPVTGDVLSLAVKDGATVKHGDTIAVVEAMKMETPIAATADGVITFAVKQGDKIETGTVIANIN